MGLSPLNFLWRVFTRYMWNEPSGLVQGDTVVQWLEVEKFEAIFFIDGFQDLKLN